MNELVRKYLKSGKAEVDRCARTSATEKACTVLPKYRRLVGYKVDSVYLHASRRPVGYMLGRQIICKEFDIIGSEEVKAAAAEFVKIIDCMAAKREKMAFHMSSRLSLSQTFPLLITHFLWICLNG